MHTTIFSSPHLRYIVACALAVIAACVPPSAAARDAVSETWVELFNGTNLEGWVRRGGKAEYAVVDGTIVGTSKPNTSNTFLCTARDYGDFTLEYEIKATAALNSGVQIRSHAFDEDAQVDLGEGKTTKIRKGVVHGYQVEFDVNQPKRVWTAGIYDESRRGWLYPGPGGGDPDAFARQGQELIKRDDWNKVRVEARGPSIKTYLNGEARADLTDGMSLEGFIALQVHGVGANEKPMQVSWRNLRIQVQEKN